MLPRVSTSSAGKIKTSQIALPKDVCDVVYATSGYEASVGNLANISLTTDMVFRDGVASQLPTMSGNATNGYTAVLPIGVNV